MTVEEGHPDYPKLLAIYEEDPKKGYVVAPGGAHYKVLKPDDTTVKFTPLGGIDGTYGSLSGGMIGG